jgi:hypothetical protein
MSFLKKTAGRGIVCPLYTPAAFVPFPIEETAMSTLLSRDAFKQAVFKRSGGLCVLCQARAVDAHHIVDRKLWVDGGYYLDNGAAVCEACHWLCEKTTVSVEAVRAAAGIDSVLLPPDLHGTVDKWGNRLLPDGQREKGPLFDDHGVQKILRQAGLLHCFD